MFVFLTAANVLLAQLRRRYRVIHVHSLPDFLVFAALPCRVLGARLILDLHESMPEIYRARFPRRGGSLLERLAVFGQRVSCAFANLIVTVNPEIAGILESRGVPAERVIIIENSPDWSPAMAVPSGVKGPDESHQIIILGGLNSERDIPVVIQAAHIMRSGPRIQWRIIGPGEAVYVRALRDSVHAFGLDGIVSIEEEVSAEMARSLLPKTIVGVVSYQLNPLTQIATPNKAYEYAVAGKAMVVADLKGLRTLLGDAPLYYRPGDSQDLAQKIGFLVENSSERERRGQAARQQIDGHRWDIMAKRLVAAYRECLSNQDMQPEKDVTRRSTEERSGGPLDGR